MRWVLLIVFIACVVHTHRRGKVRHRLFRQLSDHSTFTAPLNCFSDAFSSVPTTPFIDIGHFPELAVLQREWRTFRDEALALRDSSRIKASAEYNDIGFNSFFRNGWKRFYLKWYDAPHPSAQSLCPRTVEILSRIPSIKAAMFAQLRPGGKLGRHRDPYAGSLRYHLGLDTPNDAAGRIVVDGESYAWRDGEAVMFDETYLHWAENRTEHDRVILFCDIDRPMKYRWAQRVNDAFGQLLMRAAASPNETGDRTGGLNHAFKYLYAIRRVGKRLKAWNRTVYYIVKWALFGGIAVAIFWV
ncbi:lipid A hydroxylase LpxO [Burkholderia vietnamiensis]|uniref:lipid A hydroxylase LpxO n=2 Tax=Burkholderia vietnamiensis TaxID=60552 RepID=UPI000D7834B8|nr:lipid A hydroxylase LpxO [Burkholderia vietnamiensis]GBH25093.1 aspartyl/asparaginyl beta-hydroxylase [Burkholderia vietnamiensis]